MRNTILIILIVGLTFAGCSDNSDNPLVSSYIPTNKITDSSDLTDLSENNSRGTVMNGSTDTKKIKLSQVIDGDNGGEIILDTTYINSEKRAVSVFIHLRFPAGAFDGKKKIKLTPYPDDLQVKIQPHMTFNKVVKLDYTITGLDLAAMGFTENDNHVDFAYISSNGDIELIQSLDSKVYTEQNMIKLNSGKLYHFSRYGWVR